MRRMLALVLLATFAGSQGAGGRDGTTGILFVARDASVESDAIHRVAWRALEPHDVARRRMATFGGDMKKARAYLRANREAKVVVAYDRQIAFLAASELPKAAILKVYEEHGAHVHAWTDRNRFLAAVSLLPGVSRQDLEETRKFVAQLRRTSRDLSSIRRIGGFFWIQEGTAGHDGDDTLVSTSAHVAEGRAILTMRPDPRSLGLHVAAQVLRYLRHDKPFARVTVKRMRLTVDLGAAARAGVTVPLRLLARADVVRRNP